MKNTKKLTLLGMSAALALILSYIEAQLPSIGVPGAKIGLANIAIVFVLYRIGWKEAFAVSFIRILVISFIFWNFIALAYSIAGAAFSLAVMGMLKKTGVFSVVGVSVAGGVCHNIGQIIMAALIMGTAQIAFYLPVLILTGVTAGIAIGLTAALLVKYVKL